MELNKNIDLSFLVLGKCVTFLILFTEKARLLHKKYSNSFY